MSVPPPEPPPPGGHGSRATAAGVPPAAGFGPSQAPPGAGNGRAVLLTLTIVGLIVAMIGTLFVLGVFSARKYLRGTTTLEAKNMLGALGKDAAETYASEGRLCPSVSQPVPLDPSQIRGMKYQSQSSDWEVDRPRNAGFYCLRFSMAAPQYYQYRYDSTPSSFVASARGDLNGDGKLSNFRLKGVVESSTLHLAPTIDVIDPEE